MSRGKRDLVVTLVGMLLSAVTAWVTTTTVIPHPISVPHEIIDADRAIVHLSNSSYGQVHVDRELPTNGLVVVSSAGHRDSKFGPAGWGPLYHCFWRRMPNTERGFEILVHDFRSESYDEKVEVHWAILRPIQTATK